MTDIPDKARRALLGAAGLTALLAAAPALATPAAATPALTARLGRLIALFDKAERECERFDVEVEMPARQACGAAKEAAFGAITEDVPHEVATTTFLNLDNKVVRLSTEFVGTVAVSRRVANDPTWADMGDADWRQAHQEIAVAADRRDAILQQQADAKAKVAARIEREHRVEALAARSATLSARRGRLWDAVVTMPAASLFDVVAKLDFVDRDGCGMEDFVLTAIAADVRQLATGARA